MAQPTNGDSTGSNGEQLLTPLLTPVSEEWPEEQQATPYLNGEGHDGDNESALPLPSPSDGRNRSTSLPAARVPKTPQLNGSIAARRLTTTSSTLGKKDPGREVLKLSPAQIQELTSAPGSIPIRSASFSDHDRTFPQQVNGSDAQTWSDESPEPTGNPVDGFRAHTGDHITAEAPSTRKESVDTEPGNRVEAVVSRRTIGLEAPANGPSTPQNIAPRNDTSSGNGLSEAARQGSDSKVPAALLDPLPSPMPDSLPLPPYSMPTYLHLELASERPSPLYIRRSTNADIPYEPTSVKFERLLNFLLLPPQLERVLLFGALTCLDAWLYTFTILPLRFLKALWMLVEWFFGSVKREVRYLARFVYSGLGRVWNRQSGASRRESGSMISSRRPSETVSDAGTTSAESRSQIKSANGTTVTSHSSHDSGKHHRRTRSIPSALQQNHKADLLQGALIIISCMILLRFDANWMYHGIRGQGAIKLYVIYNVLEVIDRLFSALGQDIIECLFSTETLERKPNGRSKIIKPIWMFILALVYTVIHATAFLYQVTTLNVAVNSYSNALLTLLMSNQFVEIKGTVFKKFEKENLFQLTCADVVERFQLWLMLLIIALRNIVELGGLSAGTGEFTGPSNSGSPENATSDAPLRAFGILPTSFTILPSLFPAQVLGPFLLVLGSEMLVDWLKHAYITKFNATSPALYARFFDVLAKDYYSNAFGTQNLVRRLGLPTIPLACLFIPAILQIYHMFVKKTISPPKIGFSTATSLSVENEPTASPVLEQIDHIFRKALGHSSFGGGLHPSQGSWWGWSLDDAIALTTMLVFFLALYLLLLAFKLILGMILLGVARKRYHGMKQREQERVVETQGKRYGAWGTVEVGEDRRRWIYHGDPDGLKSLREKEAKSKEKEKESRASGKGDRLEGVDRYRMVAKRIW